MIDLTEVRGWWRHGKKNQSLQEILWNLKYLYFSVRNWKDGGGNVTVKKVSTFLSWVSFFSQSLYSLFSDHLSILLRHCVKEKDNGIQALLLKFASFSKVQALKKGHRPMKRTERSEVNSCIAKRWKIVNEFNILSWWKPWIK